MLPYDPQQSDHMAAAGRLEGDFHFVMANLSPWITSIDWLPIRDRSLENTFNILASPGMGPDGLRGYFRALKKAVGKDAVWIGHGNADIYNTYQLLRHEMRITNWFFDSNLSQRSMMILRSTYL